MYVIIMVTHPHAGIAGFAVFKDLGDKDRMTKLCTASYVEAKLRVLVGSVDLNPAAICLAFPRLLQSLQHLSHKHQLVPTRLRTSMLL